MIFLKGTLPFCGLWAKRLQNLKILQNLDDLRSMFHLIPKDCLDFYKSLQGDENIEDDLEGFSGQPDFHIENVSQEE